MMTTAIIAEYNPFHNGHMYHLQKSAAASGADFILSIMSGDFVQRGEPAIISKWKRAEAAIKSGINLVLELPALCSTASAETFAFGAVKILNDLGIIDNLCFGAESSDLDPLLDLSNILIKEDRKLKIHIKDALARGVSYPKARYMAIDALYPELADHLSGSNNILAIEYLKAIIRYKSNINPVLIKRTGSDYKSEKTQGQYSSATSIRELIYNKQDYVPYIPEYSKKIIDGSEIAKLSLFSGVLLYKLRTSDLRHLKTYDYMNDGLGNILHKNAAHVSTLDELINKSLSKRHTETRLKRALISLLLEITPALRKTIIDPDVKSYIRILAFDDKGISFLSKIKKNDRVSIITKAANYKRILDRSLYTSFEKDLLASDIYTTFCSDTFVPDISKSPIRLQ